MNALTEYLNRTGEFWWVHTHSMAWQVAAVFLIVAVLSLVFRKLPAAYRYGLWLLLLVKLLLPPSLALITGIGYWLRPPDVIAPPPAVVSVPMNPIPDSDYSPSLPPAEPVVIAPYTPPRPSLTWQGGLFGAWLAVAAALLVLIAARTRRFRVAVRSGHEPADPGIIAAWERCKRKMGITRRVRLVESDRVDSPVVMGIFRPVVVLPAGLACRGGDLEPVLLHELAHIRRRDVPVNWIQVLLQVVYWYHPCVWLANRMIRREREQACDDLVLTHLGGDPREYASSLLEIARRSAGSSWLTAGFLGMAEPGGDVGGRIRRILDAGRKIAPGLTRWVLVALLALGATVLPWGKREATVAEEPAADTTIGAAALTGTADKGLQIADSGETLGDTATIGDEPCPPGASPNTAAKLGRKIGSFEIPEPTSLHTVVKKILQVLSQIDFVVPDGADETVALRVSDMKPRGILDFLLLPAGYVWECSGESILVTRNPVAARRRELFLALARKDTNESAGVGNPLEKKVERPLWIEGPVGIGTFLMALSPMIREPSGHVSYMVQGGNDIEVEIATQGKTLREILDEIVAGNNLAWEVWDGRILITGDSRTRLFPLTRSEYEGVLVALNSRSPSDPDRLKEIHFVVEGMTYSRRDDPAVVRKTVLDVLAGAGGRK